MIKQLRRVQNAAARVVTLSPKFCRIKPVLTNLHWFPIDLLIEFKILTRLSMDLLLFILKIFFKVTPSTGS